MVTVRASEAARFSPRVPKGTRLSVAASRSSNSSPTFARNAGRSSSNVPFTAGRSGGAEYRTGVCGSDWPFLRMFMRTSESMKSGSDAS